MEVRRQVGTPGTAQGDCPPGGRTEGAGEVGGGVCRVCSVGRRLGQPGAVSCSPRVPRGPERPRASGKGTSGPVTPHVSIAGEQTGIFKTSTVAQRAVGSPGTDGRGTPSGGRPSIGGGPRRFQKMPVQNYAWYKLKMTCTGYPPKRLLFSACPSYSKSVLVWKFPSLANEIIPSLKAKRSVAKRRRFTWASSRCS